MEIWGSFGEVSVWVLVGKVKVGWGGGPLEGDIRLGHVDVVPLVVLVEVKRKGQGVEDFVRDEGAEVGLNFFWRSDELSGKLQVFANGLVSGAERFADAVGGG